MGLPETVDFGRYPRTDVSVLAQSRCVLVVDDDPRICRLLTRFLTAEGYTAESASNGQAMKQAMRARPFDLVILDLRLPGGEDGLSLAQQLRSQSNIPLIILTGLSDNVDKVVGLEVGADDYVTKPFDRRELLARIRSLLRRAASRPDEATPRNNQGSVVRFAGWTLDLGSHDLVSARGKSVELTSYEYELLATLAQRPLRVLSRERILDLIAHRDWEPHDRSIDVLIGKLRRKLGDNPKSPGLIKTIRGVGYMFTAGIEGG